MTIAIVSVLAAGLGLVTPSVAAAAPPVCQSLPTGGPVFVTATCTDPILNQPYTDIDEQRTLTDPETGVTVSFRYVHGGFTATNAKFALYFPDAANYQGRFFQSTYPTVGQEDANPNAVVFALSNGAYVVQSNNAGGVAVAGEIGGYRVNAAAAKYSRVVAARIYPNSARPRGYIYGLSGGAYQTLGAAENTDGVYDGAVPVVPGTPNGIPSYSTVGLLGLRVLHDKLPQIVAAMEPGGSGNPYAGLTSEQRSVLREATRLGFPLRGWWQYASLADGGPLASTSGSIRYADPGYLADFWNTPGYAGTDPTASAASARIQSDATVVSVAGDPRSQLVLNNVPPGNLMGADLVVTSGAMAGTTLTIGTVAGNSVGLATGTDPSVIGAIQPGDQVHIDNSWQIAIQYYHRYSVPTPDLYGWNQFRDRQGNPSQPQRPYLLGPLFAAAAGGAAPTGKFHGKMIMLSSLLDIEAFAWSADWYRTQAGKNLGRKLDDNYRLWFMDNAGHIPPTTTDAQTHVVSYQGELQQALLDLDAWVLTGKRPPASTRYSVSANNQVEVPATASARKGTQPTVDLSVKKSGDSARVAVGQPVTFSVNAQVPPGTGKIVAVEWDFEGLGVFPAKSTTNRGVVNNLTATYTFTTPGTYYPVVRVSANRDGDTETPFGLVQNLDRVRVVVR